MRRRTMYVLLVTFLLLATALIPSFANAQSGAGTYDDTNANVHYVGSWSANSGSGYANAINGTTHTSNDPNTSLVYFTFSGSYITYFYTMASNRGQFQVIIDGIDKGTFNACTPETRRQIGKTWYVGYGVHTINVYPRGSGCTGGWTDIDAFVVDIQAYSTGTYDDTDSAIRKVGTWTAGNLSGPFSGTDSWSQNAGDLFRLTFAQTGVALYYTRDANRGKVAVTIDGADKGYLNAGSFIPIDFYSASTVWQAAHWWIGLSSYNSPIHVITVTGTGLQNAAASGHFIDVDAMEVLPCPVNNGSCRAYSRAYRHFNTDYTAIRADVTFADPIISTDPCGLSSQVLWIGNTTTKTHSNYVEIGWRKECWNNGTPYIYWQAYNAAGQSIKFQQFANVTGTHTYAIERRTNNNWYFMIDGQDKDLISTSIVGPTSSTIKIGGEVADYGSQHDQLACVNHTSLQFKRNFGGWIDWNGWDYSQSDYAYNFVPIFSGFSTNGYTSCGT